MASLTFTAVLREDGTLDVEPGFVVDAEPTRDDGPVEVVVLGRRGRPLARTRLPLIAACGPPVPGASTEPAAPVVVGVVAYPAGATGLQVNIDGRQVWVREAPTDRLEVRIDWPQDLRRDRLDVTWRASTEGCQAVLAFSADGGQTWLPLSVPSSSEQIVADLTTVSGGQQCLLELFVTNGFASQRLRSQLYALEAAGWRMWILSPADGGHVDAGSVTTLVGQAFHAEERQASFDVAWSSSLDGALGSGGRLPVSLSSGRHMITATAQGRSTIITVESS
jgi:hypothetical protein